MPTTRATLWAGCASPAAAFGSSGGGGKGDCCAAASNAPNSNMRIRAQRNILKPDVASQPFVNIALARVMHQHFLQTVLPCRPSSVGSPMKRRTHLPSIRERGLLPKDPRALYLPDVVPKGMGKEIVLQCYLTEHRWQGREGFRVQGPLRA